METSGSAVRRERWSIQQVARMSGVTSRTLRYYDEIGLLPPALVGGNGYRYYERPQLLRLQEILLLRDLGMELGHIGQVIDGERDRTEALRHHHELLVAERDRFDRLARTVAATIAGIEEGTDISAEGMFAGFRFTPETLDELEDLQATRTGERSPHFDRIRDVIQDWSDEAFRRFEQDSAAIERRMLNLLLEGVACDDPRVFAVLDDDRGVQERLVSLGRDEYVKLAEAFVAAPELRAHLDARDPALADYLREAMVAYAAAWMG